MCCFQSPVYFYYELHDTFMMHRSLNQAYCKKQLITGESNECDSFKNQNYSCENAVSRSFIPKMAMFCVDNQKYYAPVGGAASIMFNGMFSIQTLNIFFFFRLFQFNIQRLSNCLDRRRGDR